MGAWGHDSFDNDDACDWAANFDVGDDGRPAPADLTIVESALAAVLDESEYVESNVGCEAIAACEVLARLRGKPGRQDAYSESIDRWVAATTDRPGDDLVARAVTALDRILAPASELRELWEDADGPDGDWHRAVRDLRSRLTA
jgi:hypothetical protein